MLDKFRKQLVSDRMNLKSLTAMVLFGAIILVFVLFGMQGRHTAMGVGAAAEVNSELISLADLRSETARMEQMYGQIFGGQMNGDMQRQFLQSQALENLISAELTSQAAQAQGILATDAEIRDVVLSEVPAFQRDGHFQKEAYVQILEANHMSPTDFESRVRKERKSVRARELFQAVTALDPVELEKAQALKTNQLNVAFAKIEEEKLQARLQGSESEIKTELAKPEFVKQVQAEFAANKSTYSIPEQVHAQHLLLKVRPGDTAGEQAAKDKINELRKRAQTEDFGKLAAEFSEDQGAAVNKGDLGTFTKGKMVPEFDKAAFAQKVGEVGEPVRSSYGFHLIKVLSHDLAKEMKLEDVQETIAHKILFRQRLEASLKTLEQALAQNDSTAVDQALGKLGVTWSETGFFDFSAEQVPQLNSRLASSAVFELSATKPLLNHLVQDGTQKFVLKWKAAKKTETGAAKFERTGEQSNRERAMDLFGKWIDQYRKTAHIEKNQQALSGQ